MTNQAPERKGKCHVIGSAWAIKKVFCHNLKYIIMRTKRATRYNSPVEHNQFGIYNWFRLKGINNKEIMQETIHNFCKDNGFYMEGFNFSKGKEVQICN